MIFNLRFGERRLIVNTPINRPCAFVNVTAFDEATEEPCRFRLVMVGHRQIRIVPIAQNAEPLKIPRLSFQRFGSVFTTSTANGHRRHVCLFRAQLALDIQFDRQPMAIVAGDVRRVVAHHRARLDDEVFQDLVHCRAEMNVGVRIRRAVVEDKFFRTLSGAPNLFV